MNYMKLAIVFLLLLPLIPGSGYETSQKDQYEKDLRTSLSQMSKCLRDEDKFWSAKMDQASKRAQELFTRDANIDAKYKFVVEIKSYYGGMGSFNDIAIPQACGTLHNDIYALLTNLSRCYWKDLGREWHDYSKFNILSAGTKVKLIPNKVVIAGDSPRVLDTKVNDLKKVWTVIKCDGPDITNMPTYFLKSGSLFRTARQEAIQIVEQK